MTFLRRYIIIIITTTPCPPDGRRRRRRPGDFTFGVFVFSPSSPVSQLFPSGHAALYYFLIQYSYLPRVKTAPRRDDKCSPQLPPTTTTLYIILLYSVYTHHSHAHSEKHTRTRTTCVLKAPSTDTDFTLSARV